jgi:phenylpropionate dioxygenase-like ring-hydroxylating dioxygenase large terminal subunit
MSEPLVAPEMPGWPEQKLRGHRIPGSRYTSRDFAEKEFEEMWTRVWLLLGRESEMPNAGDWQREEVGTMVGMVDRDAEVEHKVFELGEESMGMTIDQDIAVFTQQQKGFRSRGFKGVYLSNQEGRVRRYHELIDDYIEGRRGRRPKSASG